MPLVKRKFLASANSHEVQCEHHLVAGLFACGNFLVAGRRRRRPLRVSKNSLLASIKNFSTPFFHRLWITFPTTLGKTGSFPQAIIFICVSAVYFQNFDQSYGFSASFADLTQIFKISANFATQKSFSYISRFSASFATQTKFN